MKTSCAVFGGLRICSESSVRRISLECFATPAHLLCALAALLLSLFLGLQVSDGSTVATVGACVFLKAPQSLQPPFRGRGSEAPVRGGRLGVGPCNPPSASDSRDEASLRVSLSSSPPFAFAAQGAAAGSDRRVLFLPVVRARRRGTAASSAAVKAAPSAIDARHRRRRLMQGVREKGRVVDAVVGDDSSLAFLNGSDGASREGPSLREASVSELRTRLGPVVTFAFPSLDSTQKWSLRRLSELAGFFLGESLPGYSGGDSSAAVSPSPRVERAGRGAEEKGVGRLLCVCAETQTAGVGTRGFDSAERKWLSAPGSLSVTYLVSWPLERRELLLRLPQIAGLAVLRVLRRLGVGTGARLKWVNDVLVDGRKIAGVLCQDTGKSPLAIRRPSSAAGALPPEEAEAQSIVLLGIGVNVLSHPPDLLPGAYEGAVSVASLIREKRKKSEGPSFLHSGADGDAAQPQQHGRFWRRGGEETNLVPDAETLSVAVVKRQLDEELQALLHELLTEGPAGLEGELRRSLAFLHQKVKFELPPSGERGEEVSGVVEGIGSDGSLELRLPDGSLRRFTTGRLRKAEGQSMTDA